MSYERDDDATLLARLTAEATEISRYRGTMTPEERLTIEALDCARHGDFDEAKHRLRLRDGPSKFPSVSSCIKQYEAAMCETRRARESCV